MSLIFLDDEQRFFKQPAEVWQIIFNYCLEPDTHQSSSLRALRIVFATVSKEFNKLIKKVLTKSPHPYRQLRLANYLCTYGYTSLLQYALANGLRVVTDALSVASQKGYLDCLKVLADHGCKMCPAIIDDAALKGHRHVVEYLIEERRIRPIDTTMKNAVLSGQVDLVKYLQKYVILRAYADIGRDAATSGSLDMVKYIEQIAPLEQKNIIASAQNGSIAIFQYYIDKGFAVNDHLLCLTAIVNRHLNYVKLAIDHGAPLSEELMQGVTKMNDVEFMKELRARGCPWDGSSIKQAASDGRLKALEFLIDNGCPFTENTDSSWLRYGFTYSLASKNDATVMASYGGHFECLKYLMEHGAPWPNDLINKVFFMSTKTNALAIVKYLHERGCPWDAKTCSDAVARGYFELLKYLHQNKCPWDKRTCEIAALMGRSDMLKYAIENKCPLDNETMTRALESGSVEVLKLVHESGIPLPSDACTRLLVRGTPDALKYAHENGGQWAADSVRKALEHVTNENTMLPRLIYAIENGCPWDPKEALALVKKNYCLNISEWIQHNAMTD